LNGKKPPQSPTQVGIGGVIAILGNRILAVIGTEGRRCPSLVFIVPLHTAPRQALRCSIAVAASDFRSPRGLR
jgi:hypothetical protein